LSYPSNKPKLAPAPVVEEPDEDDGSMTRVSFSCPAKQYVTEYYRIDAPSRLTMPGMEAELRRYILDNAHDADLRDTDCHDCDTDWSEMEIS
jgi:hypothetical protein